MWFSLTIFSYTLFSDHLKVLQQNQGEDYLLLAVRKFPVKNLLTHWFFLLSPWIYHMKFSVQIFALPPDRTFYKSPYIVVVCHLLQTVLCFYHLANCSSQLNHFKNIFFLHFFTQKYHFIRLHNGKGPSWHTKEKKNKWYFDRFNWNIYRIFEAFTLQHFIIKTSFLNLSTIGYCISVKKIKK